MKIFESLPPPLTATFFLLMSVFACQRNAEQLVPKTLDDSAVIARSTCDIPGYCNVEITADDDAMLSICGDIPVSNTSCSSGCNPSTDKEISGEFPELETREFCVNPEASLCITNLSTTTSVGVRVLFGSSSTALFETLSPLETHCFHTNGGCNVTLDDCL